MLKKNKRRWINVVVVLVMLIFVQGCTLAKEEKTLEKTQDKLIGAWVLLKNPGEGQDEDMDLQDFKKEDAHVIYLDAFIKDEARYLDLVSTGRVYGGSTSIHVGEDSSRTDVEAKVYFSSTTKELITLYPIYEKADGERYATKGEAWMMVGEESEAGSLGSLFIRSEFSEKRTQSPGENEVIFNVEFERTKDLVEAEIIHLDENYNILSKEELDLDKMMNGDDQIDFTVNKDAHMVVVEETFKSLEQESPYVLRTLYSSGPNKISTEENSEDLIIHNFILPVEKDLSKKVAMEFKF